MSKSDQNALKNQAQQQQNQNNTQTNSTNDQLQGMLGGYQNTSSSILPGVKSSYENIGSTGGYDPAILGSVRDTYGDMAKTGGISDADATAMRNRSAEAAKGTYDVAAGQAQRTASATGGYGDTSPAILGDLARKGSQAASTAATGADASIAGLRQTGKLAGAGGLASTEQSLTGNRLAAAGGLTNIYGLNESEVHSTVDSILRNFQVNGQLSVEEQQVLSHLATVPGVFDKIVGSIGTLGGAAAGIIGGINEGKH